MKSPIDRSEGSSIRPIVITEFAEFAASHRQNDVDGQKMRLFELFCKPSVANSLRVAAFWDGRRESAHGSRDDGEARTNVVAFAVLVRRWSSSSEVDMR